MSKVILENGQELNYCPNCGGKPRLEMAFSNKPTRSNERLYHECIGSLADYPARYFVRCVECGLGTPCCESQKQAIEQWNNKKDLF